MTMLSDDDLNLRHMSREELDAAWDLWFDLAQTTNDHDPPYTHGVFADGEGARAVVMPSLRESAFSIVVGLDDRRAAETTLLANLKKHETDVRALLDNASSHWGYEDLIYRFYHQSFKVFHLQSQTTAIVGCLENLMPDRPLHPWFQAIVAQGTGHTFTTEDNRHWLEVSRPVLEAFFHARFFLEMAARYAGLESPPSPMPSGYAALLYLYQLR
jgi:hypothetical protein